METQARKPYPSDVSDEEWAFVAPSLTLMTPNAPQRRYELREIFNALRWIVRTGAPWRDLPAPYGKWQTVYSRFRRWRAAGMWDEILRILQWEAACNDEQDGSLAMLDGTNVRGHQQAAGQRKKGAPTPHSTAAGAAGAASCT